MFLNIIIKPTPEFTNNPDSNAPNDTVEFIYNSVIINDEAQLGIRPTIEAIKAKKEIAKLEYDWLWEHLEEYCPKNTASYTKMKNSNSKKFQEIVLKAQEKGFNITII